MPDFQVKLGSYLVSITFLMATCFSISHAQISDTTRNLSENGWIEQMDNNISMKVSLNNDYEIFKVSTDYADIILYPNITTVSRLNVNYRFVSLAVKMAPGFFPGNGDEDTKGSTKSFGLHSSFIFRNWFFSAGYSRVKGYYLKNTDDFSPREEDDPYIQFPDLLYKGFSFSAGYNVNPKLSLKSLTTQTERQLKSAGSFTPLFNFRYYIMDDRDTLASSTGAKQKSNTMEWSIGAGYIYNFVFKNRFYASMGITPAIGFIGTKFITSGPNVSFEERKNNLAFRWDCTGGLGYNGRDFFSGIYVSYTGILYEQQYSTVLNHETRVFYQVFVGVRIRAPRALSRFVDGIESGI